LESHLIDIFDEDNEEELIALRKIIDLIKKRIIFIKYK
jgi:hypothetical protein